MAVATQQNCPVENIGGPQCEGLPGMPGTKGPGPAPTADRPVNTHLAPRAVEDRAIVRAVREGTASNVEKATRRPRSSPLRESGAT